MEVRFYNTSSGANVVHKQLTSTITLQCDIYDSCSVKRPRLRVNMNNALINSNYMYIPKWNRYYYISAPIIFDGSNAIVEGAVDELMSYWDDFKTSPCIAKRSTSNWNPMMEDTRVFHAPNKKYVVRKMGQGFNPSSSGGSYILTIGGK